MKDISIYFSSLETVENPVSESLGEFIVRHDGSGFPEIDRAGVALIYVPEFRNGEMSLHGQADDRFRNQLSAYFPTANWNFKIYDLGNLMPGERVEDTYFALRQVVAELVKKSVIPFVIGGSQDLTYAMYQGYEELEQLINVLNVDSRLDLGDPELPIGKDAYVSKLLMHRPCYLFNLSVIGYQTPLVKASEIDLFEKLFFDAIRLGEFKNDFRVAEPLLRNTDLLSIDLQSIKASDFKGKYFSQPNGFDNMDICQIAKYGGISDKLTSVGLFNLLPGDIAESTHAEIAQIIWYFIDGYSQRVGDFPIGSKKDYTKFTVFLDEINHDIIFYRSNRSERWWMEVPYPPKEGIKYERHHLVPCDKSQYNNALNGDIPNLWWKTYQKLG